MEDSRIIDLYWARDEEAIRQSEQKYGPPCLTLAQRIVHSPEDAEECLNDTWVQAWNAMPPQRPYCLRAFFLKITRNLALSRYQYLHARKRGGGEVPLVLEELHECLPSRENAEEAVLTRELGSVVNAFLKALPRKSCDIFLRRYFYLESTSDIARDFGMRESAVLMNLSRSRKKLREHLKEVYHD